MSVLASTQNVIVLVLGVLALGCEVVALVDAVRRRPDAFVAAGKQSKRLWVVILAVATALGLVYVMNVLGLLGIVAFVASAVYLVDVRPALDRVMGRSGKRDAHRDWR